MPRDIALKLQGITSNNQYEGACADNLDALYDMDTGRLVSRPGDDLLTGLSKQICLTSEGLKNGNLAWGKDAYGTNPWTKNGVAISLPEKPALVISSVDTSSTITGTWIDTTVIPQGYVFEPAIGGANGSQYREQGISEKNVLATSLRWSTGASQDWTGKTIVDISCLLVTYGSCGWDVNDWDVYIGNDSYMGKCAILDAIDINYSSWHKYSTSMTWSDTGVQTCAWSVDTSGCPDISAVKYIELRTKPHRAPANDAEDGLVVFLPNDVKIHAGKFIGSYSYLATIEIADIEGPASEAQIITLGVKGLGIKANVTIQSAASGTATLYRAVDNSYYKVGEKAFTNATSIEIDDDLDISDIYRPGDTLPVGKAAHWGNRVIVWNGENLWVSAAGSPLKYAQGNINDDGLDPWFISFAEPINCISQDGGLVIHTTNHTYIMDGSRLLYKGDNYGSQMPRELAGQGVIASDGTITVTKHGIFSSGNLAYSMDISDTPFVVSRGDVYIYTGGKLYINLRNVPGWWIWTPPITGITCMVFDGNYLILANDTACYRIASSSTRKTGYWTSCKYAFANRSRIKWMFRKSTADIDIINGTNTILTMTSSNTEKMSCAVMRPLHQFQLRIELASNTYTEFVTMNIESIDMKGDY